MKIWRGRFLLAAAVATMVAACGGGSGSGSGSVSGPVSPPASQPPPSPPGSTKTVVVSGAITGFGSVIVNGVRYDTSGTSVRIEDRAGSVAELEVGEVVRLEAEIDDNGGRRAKSIEMRRLLQGAVESVDTTQRIVIVAGQRVRADDDTSFDDSIGGRSVAGLASGDRIEVHGFIGADGLARATRLERSEAGEIEVEVKGRVASHDPAARRFSVGSLRVDYSSAEMEDFGAAGPVDGDLVEVHGREYLADGALRAQRVAREGDRFDDGAGGEVELEGFITRFSSPGDFDVAGKQVGTTASTVFIDGEPGSLAVNVKVEVEGRLDANGVLIADKVKFKRRASVRFEAMVDGVDPAAGTFRSLGLTIAVTSGTRFEDKEGDEREFGISSLRTGDWVEVAAYEDPSASGRVIAMRLERDDREDEVELRGRASDLNAPMLKVAGVAVETTSATRFEIEDVDVSAATFFAEAGGRIVEAEGDWNGTAVVAAKLEIEEPDDGIVQPPPTQPVPPTPPTPPTPPIGNQAPVASAGSAQTVSPGAAVTLDGSGSRDPDGDALTYAWTLTRPAGSAAALSAADTSSPSFIADVAGVYTAQLVVSDGQAQSAPAAVTITARAAPVGPDGARLYADNCAGCHGPINAIRMIPASNRSASDIQRAIDSNKGGMGFLSRLTAEEVQAIASAIAAANP